MRARSFGIPAAGDLRHGALEGGDSSLLLLGRELAKRLLGNIRKLTRKLPR